MMIGGGIQQVRAIDIVHSAGYEIIVTDRNQEAPCFSSADHSASIDGRDIEGLIAYTLLNKEKLNIVGIFTLTELVTSVAAVSSACGLPGVSLASAVTCQNKLLCKNIWLKQNISTPFGEVIDNFNDATKLYEKLNQRVFVKPLVGFGGKGARKILSQNELDAYFKEYSGQLILMEELLVGSMHDVNGLFDEEGNFHPMGIVDRYFMEKHPVEKEIRTPSILKKTKQQELYVLLEHSVRALDIKWGPVKGDAILVDDKFYMFEVAPRLHGPKSSLYLLPMSGFNCLEKALNIISGKTCIDFEITQEHFTVCTAILPNPGSIFDEMKVIDSGKNSGVDECLILKKHGVTIKPYRSSSDVPAYIIASRESYKECRFVLDEMRKSI
jgi:biotin carboxylase